MKQFIKDSRFVLIGLHGGLGEDGRLQHMLDKAGVKYNGPGARASEICMDKAATCKAVEGLESEGIFVAPKRTMPVKDFEGFSVKDFDAYFADLQEELNSKTFIIKPQDEGCSSGIVRLFDAKDFRTYIQLAQKGVAQIKPGTFKNQKDPVEMPLNSMQRLLIEQFIETDFVRVKGDQLKWRRKKGWVEVTVGVLQHGNKMHALSPSLTVAEGEVLSVEEKFQGGTGVNMTPPPASHVKPEVLAKVKKSVERIAEKVGLEGYSRMDTFIHIDTGDTLLIEVNTLPALTPSTVLFHQGLAEKKPMYPLELLEKIVENKGY